MPVLGDNEEAGVYVAEQQRLVRTALEAEVLNHTAFWQKAAAEADLPPLTSPADLVLLAPRPLTAMGSPGDLLLGPPSGDLGVGGGGLSRWRGRRSGRASEATPDDGLSLEQRYKTITWLLDNQTLVGNTEGDLLRLAEIGHRTLELAGVASGDGIVSLVPPGPTLSSWQLMLGARQAGVAMAGLAPLSSCETVAMLGPVVLAGRPEDLVRVLRGSTSAVRAGIQTVLVVTRAPLERQERTSVADALGRREGIVSVWSPPGVRALWSECRSGKGAHTWPQCELIEVCAPNGSAVAPGDEGELVWTGLGWRGTVLVRLATGVHGRLVEGRCECGRTTPRVVGARLLNAPAGPRTTRRPRRAGAGVRAGMNEATTGPVRAVAKEDPPDAALVEPPTEPPTKPPTEPPTEPRPTPDLVEETRSERVVSRAVAAADAAADVWFPATSDMDAWPAPVLASTEGLAAWQVEHRRRRGHDELIVHLALAEDADLGEVLLTLERSIGATQYVVVDQSTLEARLSRAQSRSHPQN